MKTQTIESIFNEETRWNQEYKALREILKSFNLEETVKWGQACYTLNGKNVVLIHGFKEYCALLLFKGSLLTKHLDVLIQQSERVQAARQLRFTSVESITRQLNIIKNVIQEAIEIEEKGLEVSFKSHAEYPVCDELKQAFEDDATFENAFKSLTPGRQRGYQLYFSEAKFPATRIARIERYRQSILDGKGLTD